MSSNWINKFIGVPKGPNDLYSTPDLLGGMNDNKVKTNFWPGGDFDNAENPLTSLKGANGKMGQMSKNLMSNQSIMAHYIYIPRIILPLLIPRIGGHRGLIDLMKSTTSGDVVFNLRYNDSLMKAGLVSKIIRKEAGDSVFSVNLATLNYVLMSIQSFLELFRDVCVNEGTAEEFDQILRESEKDPVRIYGQKTPLEKSDQFYL